MAVLHPLEESKSTTVVSGVQFAMTIGIYVTPTWYADSLAFKKHYTLIKGLRMVREPVRYGCMNCDVQDVSQNSMNADMMDGEARMDATTAKMPVYCVLMPTLWFVWWAVAVTMAVSRFVRTGPGAQCVMTTGT